jgi:hypothetical protein
MRSTLYAIISIFNVCFIGFGRKLNNDEVSLSNCNSGTCRLKRRTDVKIMMKFTPEKDVQKIITTVNANILDIPFPFIGVDGTR